MTRTITSGRLQHRLVVVFFLMFVLPSTYLIACIYQFARLSPGSRAGFAGLKQGLAVGLPAIVLMSVSAIWLLRGSLSQLKRVVADMKEVLVELESTDEPVPDPADEVACISKCLVRIKDAFLTHMATLDGDCETLQAKNERLAQVALVDPQTELYNRKHAVKVLGVEVPRAIRHETPLSIMIIDADDFATVNAQYDRETGDRVLKELADLIDCATRRIDMVARYGGEEFLVVLPDTSFNDAVRVAERVRLTVSDRDFLAEEGLSVTLTVSTGIATLDGIMDAEKLLANAEHSLLTAKRLGSNMVLA